MDRGALLEEAAGGRWFTDWLMTRWCEMGTGNHEDWINDLALDPALAGSVTVSSALGLPPSLEVLPCGYQWRIGSLVIEHGDALFGKGSKSASPAAKALAVAPDHSTICGHLHHMDTSWRSAPDENGIMRSRVAHVAGHLSLPDAHSDYAPRNPNWQQGFTLVRVYWESGKARFSIYPIEILRDRRNRPFFEFNGKVYK